MSKCKQESVPVLSVNLFGRFQVRRAEQRISGLQQRRAQQLFAYLLLHPNRAHPRERLAALLWQDVELTQARKYLRQALWQIQVVLQDLVASDATPLLQSDAEWIQLNDSVCLQLDVADFEDAVHACQGTDGVDLTDSQRAGLERAVALYRGDLLEGWYQDWCVFARERLQNSYLTALDKLVASSDARGSVDAGLAHAERILGCDPTEEVAHYHIMRLYWSNGHRSKALRQYQRCERILQQELGVKPSTRTKRLYDQIRADSADPSSPVEAVAAAGALLLDGDKEQELMTYLRQLHLQLNDIEEQIHRDFEAVALALKTRR